MLLFIPLFRLYSELVSLVSRFILATRATKATRLSIIPIRACAPGICLFISLFRLYSKLVALVASLPLIHNKLSLSTVSKMIETRCDVL